MKQGDIIMIDFDPHIGHEQAGYRPAVVLSNDFSIEKTNIVFLCPITNTNRNFPAHIALDGRTKTTGFILCEQMRAVDTAKRPFRYVEALPDDLLSDVIDTVYALIEL